MGGSAEAISALCINLDKQSLVIKRAFGLEVELAANPLTIHVGKERFDHIDICDQGSRDRVQGYSPESREIRRKNHPVVFDDIQIRVGTTDLSEARFASIMLDRHSRKLLHGLSDRFRRSLLDVLPRQNINLIGRIVLLIESRILA